MLHLNRRRDYIYTFILFLIAFCLSRRIDPSVIKTQGIFLWDSNYYYLIGQRLLDGFHGNLVDLSSIPQPFGSRILFPFLAILVSEAFNVDFMTATYYIDVVAALLTALLLMQLWRKIGLSRSYSLLGISLWLFSWNFPLRFTHYWTGSGFALQSFIALVAILLIQNMDSKSSRLNFSLSLFFIPILCLGREFVLLIVLSVCFAKWFFSICKFETKRKPFLPFANYSSIRLVSVLVVSVFLYLFVRQLTNQSNQSIRNLVYFYFDIFWFHANVIEAIYPFFLTMGWIVLLLGIVVSQKRLRAAFKNEIRQLSIHSDLLFLLIFLSFVFSIFGGLDSDRYLIWFFPVLAILGLMALKVIRVFSVRKLSLRMILFGLILVLQSHVFLPAFPNVFAPDSSICNLYGLRTNYAPNEYRGVPYLSKLKEPMYSLPKSESLASTDTRFTITDRTWRGSKVQIPESTKACSDGNLVYKGAYKYSLNNIPIPLGYLHNQYEPWVWLPGYGDPKVKVIYLSQWILIILFFIRRSKKGEVL